MRKSDLIGKLSKLIVLDRLPVRCYAPRLSLSRNKLEYEFSNGKDYINENNSSLSDLYTHYKRIGHVIITKPHFSSRDGINSHCRRFDSLIFRCMTAVVAAPTGR